MKPEQKPDQQPLSSAFVLRINSADLVILVLTIVLLFWVYNHLWFNQSSGKADYMVVQIDTQAPVQYPLNQNRLLELDGRKGKSIIEVSQGKVRFIHSTCRNQFCVFHGWLSAPGDTTACLPNRMQHCSKSHSVKDTEHFDALAGER